MPVKAVPLLRPGRRPRLNPCCPDSSSTGRSSPGSSPSSSCWRARSRSSNLPIAQYPTIAPPSVVINATYPGADAQTLQNSVTQVIEQQLTGLDNLLYFSSVQRRDGTVTITAHLRGRHQSRHRPGAGAEQGAAGRAAPAPGRAAAGRDGRQGAPRLPHGGRRLSTTPAATQCRHCRLHHLARCRIRSAGSPGWATPRCSAPICHAHLARSLQAAQLRAEPSDVSATRCRRRTCRSPPARSAPCPPSRARRSTPPSRRSRGCRPRSSSATSSCKTNPDGAQVRLRDVARVELGAKTMPSPACSTAIPPPVLPSCWRPAPMRSRPWTRSRRGWPSCEPSFPPGMKMVYPYRQYPLHPPVDRRTW